MTDQSNVFSNEDPQGNPQQNPTPSNPTDIFANQLKSIMNEDGTQKYGTVEGALKGAEHAQQYIPQLKSQVSTLEAELVAAKAEIAKMGSVEDVVSRLTAPTQKPDDQSQPTQAPALSEEAVLNLFKQASQDLKVADQAQDNEDLVQKTMVEKFGEKAGDVLSAKAQQLNTTPKALQELARQNPSIVLSMFNETTTTQPTSSSVSLPIINPGDTAPVVPPIMSLLNRAESPSAESYKKAKATIYAKFKVEES